MSGTISTPIARPWVASGVPMKPAEPEHRGEPAVGLVALGRGVPEQERAVGADQQRRGGGGIVGGHDDVGQQQPQSRRPPGHAPVRDRPRGRVDEADHPSLEPQAADDLVQPQLDQPRWVVRGRDDDPECVDRSELCEAAAETILEHGRPSRRCRRSGPLARPTRRDPAGSSGPGAPGGVPAGAAVRLPGPDFTPIALPIAGPASAAIAVTTLRSADRNGPPVAVAPSTPRVTSPARRAATTRLPPSRSGPLARGSAAESSTSSDPPEAATSPTIPTPARASLIGPPSPSAPGAVRSVVPSPSTRRTNPRASCGRRDSSVTAAWTTGSTVSEPPIVAARS